METDRTDLVVVGAGPGGYAAAFAAARRGIHTVLVDADPRLGGVCLNRGCIPSKGYLHATAQIEEAQRSSVRGIDFAPPRIEVAKLCAWKEALVKRLEGGLRNEADRLEVRVVRGRGYFESSGRLRIETEDGQRYLDFQRAIVAVGSRSALPGKFDLGHPRVWTSRDALELEAVPDRLLVVGAGYIGMELGTVYARLGSEVVVAEGLPTILAGTDHDLVEPVMRAAKQRFREIRLETEVSEMATSGDQIKVTMQGEGGGEIEECYDAVLVAVGRRPSTDNLGLDNTGATLDEKGFVEVDESRRTGDESIYAIGDAAGEPLLAHKATREGELAVEAMCGEQPLPGDDLLVPAVVFTDPEVAWVGLTQSAAERAEKSVKAATCSWKKSGRAHTLDRSDGVTKLVLDEKTERILGVGICGHGAGELIGEGALAIEMGATAYDLAATIHPHPTLSESLMEAGWNGLRQGGS